MANEQASKLEELMKQRAAMDAQLRQFEREVTLMFTDIQGSTSYFDRFGDVDGMVYVHKCHDMVIPITEKYGGTVCKTIGDAVMAYYLSPVDAAKATIEIQKQLDAYNRGIKVEDEKIRIRIGLNYGRGLIKEKDVFGDVVNVAARIEALAKGEQIYISADVEKQIREAKIPVKQVSEVEVKGKKDKLVIYEVLWREAKGYEPDLKMGTMAPSVAARVPVAKAAEPTSEQKGTVVLDRSPVAMMASGPKALYSLVVVRPDGEHGQACKIEKKETLLGRVEGDIRFPEDNLVSRKHAKLTIMDTGLAVEDMNSANGIFWRLRTPYSLQDRDVVLMGRQMFRFMIAGADAKGGQTKTSSGKLLPQKGELVRLLPGGIEENHYPLSAAENILGRTRGNITFPEDAYLSSQHAKVKVEDGKFVLEDAQSGNGTFVQLRQKTTLKDGDIILIGHQLLRITANP